MIFFSVRNLNLLDEQLAFGNIDASVTGRMRFWFRPAFRNSDKVSRSRSAVSSGDCCRLQHALL
jgi:hypothetical protein